jgi:methylamine dehydrogenase accessory protein MauD
MAMHEALAISTIILWIVVLCLGAVVFALARQIGVLHERIAPIGALTIDKGPKVGDHAPIFELSDLAGGSRAIGSPSDRRRSTLLMFVSPTCPVCKKLMPAIKSMAGAEARWLDLIFTSDGDEAEQADFVRRNRIESYPLVLSREMGMAFHVSKLPYAVLIDEDGIVRAKGLVNTREHLESIVAAKQMGVASIQDFLRRRGDETSAGSERGGSHHG